MLRSLEMNGLPECTEVDRWAVWPCGTQCSLDEHRDFEDLLTWKSDDYEIKFARGYDNTQSPIFD